MSETLSSKTLGKLITNLCVLSIMPDEKRLAEYLSEFIPTIPGILSIGIQFKDTDFCLGELCISCGNKTETMCDTCQFAGRNDYHVYPISASNTLFGRVLIHFSSDTVFESIHPYLSNAFILVSIQIENIKNREKLQVMNQELHAALVASKSDAEALRKSEIKQKEMISNISDVIAILDRDGTVTYNSPNVERWFGWRPEDLMGTDIWTMIHPDDATFIQKEFSVVLDHDYLSKTMEYRYKCKDGHYKPIELTVVNLTNDSIINGLLINYHDITERKAEEQEKLKLQDMLAQTQKIESIGRLAGGVAHDFNNMLSIIMGNAELTLDSIPDSDPLKENIQEIISAGQRSTSVVRQLLAFARKQTISPIIINLNDIIADILKMLRRLIGEDIYLFWKPSADVWPVKMDPSQIDQLLANLAVNARDAIKDVGKVTIETANIQFDSAYCETHDGFRPGDFVMLTVSDDGCGMDKVTQAHIFEPFFTTKGVGQGTGLGLSTVYGIVTQNNGFINVYSEPGQGSTFRVYIPRCQLTEINTDKKAIEPTPPTGVETVLLVEDEQSILKLGRAMLGRLGYTVLAANSPDEAIRLAEEHDGEIQLVMTDVVMPGMNGRDLANQLLARHKNLKCLFMSGYTANVIEHHGVLDEGVHFIQKPFTKKDLAIKVRETLDHP